MTVINTNTAATITSNALANNSRSMCSSYGASFNRSTYQLRIRRCCWLAISSKMTSQIRGLDQAVRNGNDAIAMIQTADGAAIEVSNMLQRMRELSVQAASGTNTTDDMTSLNTEFTALRDQIDVVANNTEWNGTAILDGSVGSTVSATNVVSFQIGANNAQTIAIDFGDFNLAAGATAAAAGVSKGALGADISALESGYCRSDYHS